MAESKNYIIGRGETLAGPVELVSGFGDKSFPYDFDDVVDAIGKEITVVIDNIEDLPDRACPNGEAVIAITLHPSFLAKSYHPSRLLRSLGLRKVGSRERKIRPRVYVDKRKKDVELIAPELFIAGRRKDLAKLRPEFVRSFDDELADDFRKIETVRNLGEERIRVHGEDVEGYAAWELVLHTNSEGGYDSLNVVDAFRAWAKWVDPDLSLHHVQRVGGLTFLGIKAQQDSLEELCKFSFTRVVRKMPKLTLRDIKPNLKDDQISLDISSLLPLQEHVHLAILDGGIPLDHPFGSNVESLEAPGIGAPVDELIEHGVQVTSAALFGSIDDAEACPQPYCRIDHWRVLDDQADDFELSHTLDRIMDVLSQNTYDVVNISLGPDEAMLDDEVHLWTSRLDRFASTGDTLIVIAAGNNGSEDEILGLNRIQPAGDGVNLLAVGSSDRTGHDWERASYSAIGPGRSPGLVKPDILAFGGSDLQPFIVCNPNGFAAETMGTSFAAPAVSRAATGLLANFADQVSGMGLKGLLIHHAEQAEGMQHHVGWGCMPEYLDAMTTCRDDQATILYKGILEPSRYMRFPIPQPTHGFTKTVEIRATFVFATDTDPEDSINYTRTGAAISFRPKTAGHPGFNDDGKARRQHQTKTFFGKSAVFETEQALRDDAHRWEAVMRAKKSFRASSLDRAVFDIEHLSRAQGQSASRPESVPYALIVTLTEKNNTNLYSDILSAYAGQLRAIQPQLNIRVGT